MKKKNIIGGWTFLVGIVLALVVGLLSDLNTNPLILGVLVALGLIVGLLNIAEKEVTPFLTSGIILILASAFGTSVMDAIPKAVDVLQALLTLFIPATIVVAVKNVFVLAKN
jgi:hypothetical protein